MKYPTLTTLKTLLSLLREEYSGRYTVYMANDYEEHGNTCIRISATTSLAASRSDSSKDIDYIILISPYIKTAEASEWAYEEFVKMVDEITEFVDRNANLLSVQDFFDELPHGSNVRMIGGVVNDIDWNPAMSDREEGIEMLKAELTFEFQFNNVY